MFVLGRSRSGSPAVPRCCDTHICIVPTSIAATVPHVLGWSAPSSTDRLIKVGRRVKTWKRLTVLGCGRYEISVDMVATSDSTVTVSLDPLPTDADASVGLETGD